MIIIFPETAALISSNVPAGDNQTYMVDDYFNTQTEYATLIEVEVDASNCDRVALFNVDAYSVDFELTDNSDSSVVQTKSIDLSTDEGYYQEWIVESIYIYADAKLKVSINKSGGTAKCGLLRWGTSASLGKTRFGLNSRFVDYSIKDTDDFGRTYLNQGLWGKEPELNIFFDTDLLDNVYEDLVAARGQSVILEGNEDDTDYEALRVFCYLPEWTIKMNYKISELRLTVKGMV